MKRFSSKGHGYTHISIYPQTLQELREMSGKYGEAAAADVHWGAVTTCIMNDRPFSNPMPVVNVAVEHCRADDRLRLGFPDYLGRERSPAFPDLSPQSRREARLVGEETLADWRAAGSPYLTENRLKRAYQYIQSCIRNAAEAEQNTIKEKAA